MMLGCGLVDVAFNKFRSCKWNDGFYCYKPVKGFFNRIIHLVFSFNKHDVGVNGFSILAHCGRCEDYKNKE